MRTLTVLFGLLLLSSCSSHEVTRTRDTRVETERAAQQRTTHKKIATQERRRTNKVAVDNARADEERLEDASNDPVLYHDGQRRSSAIVPDTTGVPVTSNTRESYLKGADTRLNSYEKKVADLKRRSRRASEVTLRKEVGGFEERAARARAELTELRRTEKAHFDLKRRSFDEHLEELQRELNSVYAE